MTMHRAIAAILITIAATYAAPLTSADAQPDFIALPLPPGTTIDPEGARRQMKFSPDGTLYAIVATPSDNPQGIAVRWHGTHRERYTSVRNEWDAFPISVPRVSAIAPTATGAYVTIGRVHDGAYLGMRTFLERWTANGHAAWQPPDCAVHTTVYGRPHILDAGARRAALTMDPNEDATSMVDFSDPVSIAEQLPSAFILTPGGCIPLGPAILTAVHGTNVAGYIGLLNGKPAPWFARETDQTPQALRWRNGHRDVLGIGVPTAINDAGEVVGSTAPTDVRAGESPHALVWSAPGKGRRLFRNDDRSVAWDINDAGTIVGMMQTTDGVHHAFIALHHHIRMLDTYPHPAGWRFESAYAITDTGTVAGIGTYHGIATAFRWRVPAS